MTKEFLESCLAKGLSLEQIGKLANRSPSTVSYHLRKHRLSPVNSGRHSNKGGIALDLLERLIAEGKSARQIARELERSPSTVNYWIQKHELEPPRHGGHQRRALEARARGETNFEAECRHHGLTMFYVAPNGHYTCKRCRTERVARWRREAKRKLIEAAGGCCVLCGYDGSPGALHFHHLDPSTKEFGLASKGHVRSLERLMAEAEKCVLLCANCHSEVERGEAELPQDLVPCGSSGVDKLNRRAS